jgi:prolyl 4-hydroxylase
VTGPAHDRIEKLTGIPYANAEWWQLLKYIPGQYYMEHHDYINYESKRPQGPRILTGFFYLNDVEAGGGTNFTKLDLTVMPKKGMALFWPSVRDDAPFKKDRRLNHEALVVEAGFKYGANVWYVLVQLRGERKRN